MNKFEKILLTIFFVELFIGGGGRLIDFGVVSIRQLLFGTVILTYIYRLVRERALLNKELNTFIQFSPVTIGMYLLLLWFVASAFIGIINGHPISVIVTDFLRVSFFMVYFPLAYYISAVRYPKNKIVDLLKIGALIVAVFTIIVSLLGKTVYSDNFTQFYNFMNWIMNDDLYFRPSNSVFYKSHLFVLIGIILSLNAVLDKKYNKFDIAIIIFGSISVLWSETRGFLLAWMLSIIVILLLDAKILTDHVKGFAKKVHKVMTTRHYVKKLSIFFLLLISLPFLYNYMTLERFEQITVEEGYEEGSGSGSYSGTDSDGESDHQKEVKKEVNDVSVNNRLDFIYASKDILLGNPTSLIIGTGYGMDIGGRLLGLEMSFLEILVEQGVIGLSIWVFLFLIPYYNYYYAYKRGGKINTIDISLLAAFMGLLLLTNINPFINNPIGISFFLILLIISQNLKEKVIREKSV